MASVSPATTAAEAVRLHTGLSVDCHRSMCGTNASTYAITWRFRRTLRVNHGCVSPLCYYSKLS